MTRRWTFNIVYTAGTVAYLLPFVHSLLRHSDADFRLVDNGCLPPERLLLAAFAARHPRLQVWTMPGEGCRPHGEVLNSLCRLQTPGPFCFLDSDIVASGPFLAPLQQALATGSAAFSGPPVWLPDGDGVFRRGDRSMTGELIWDEQGRCLSCTYVAAYAADRLGEAIARHDVGFDEYRWEALSPDVQARLDHLGRRAGRYDTGKVLASLVEGPAVYVGLANLHHIGGFSFPALDGSAVRGDVRGGRLPAPLRRLAAIWRYRRAGGVGEAARLARRRVLYRDPVRRHFWALTHALLRGDDAPPPPRTGAVDVDRRVAAATEAIRRCYADFRASEPLLKGGGRG